MTWFLATSLSRLWRAALMEYRVAGRTPWATAMVPVRVQARRRR